uniref:PA domain-containing protein n=1 Tax=Corethron hystrix TaxID=216773 RepID=A0A7S1FV28_9STRA|mmetsp:Transcript_31707/g.72758  ORF Transcript_31707/g.72758 Transcript_31707/m.72758 type:complete len:344 (+) Transcript_31707:195-1226(+)
MIKMTMLSHVDVGIAIISALVSSDAAAVNLPPMSAVPAYHASSRFQIQIPKDLFRVEGYDHREALFGVPPYGGSIAQQVYYADDTLCDSDVDKRKGYPIRPNLDDGKMGPWEPPYILMVDRGDCTFVHKARNAQKAGAAGVLISDNTCLCSNAEICTPLSDGDPCEQFEPVMADDGSGSDITIPTFLLFKQDADAIREVLMSENGNIVQAEMAWNIPRPDDRVEYKFWTVPTEHISKNFQKTFRDAAVQLGDSAYFTPHFFVYDGILNRCHGTTGNQCFTMCTNAGRYCAVDPDNHLDRGISGADVVRESLRRICIWKYYGKDGIGETVGLFFLTFFLRFVMA